jgi:hypothetical protein
MSQMDHSEVLAMARARLEKVVSEGVAKAGPVIESVLANAPRDSIVQGQGLTFVVEDKRVMMVDRPLHNHALAQVVERAGVPLPYARGLVAPEAWRQQLLEHTLREHYSHQGGRYLVREAGGQVRGFLSDKYRRLDSRPLLDAFVGGCQQVGAVPFEGVANEVRTSVRAIIPCIYEPVPGEAMVFGLAWNNSDYGAGIYGVSAFALRLVCLNGMVGESQLKQVHLGGKLPDNIEFSARTYASDTKTMVSATVDIVRSTLGPAAIERRVQAIRAAHENETSFAKAFGKIGAALSKAEQTAVKEAFEGTETLMLPPGKTLWRASNALSWIANKTDDADRKLELQQAAGKILAA